MAAPALHILYEDNHCLVLAKPAPLLTQGLAGRADSLEDQARAYLRERYGKKGRVYLGIPHRLDRPVSGVVLFARQTVSAQRLALQFQQHQVEKVYWALVDGMVPTSEGTWEDWLRKLPTEARTEVVPEQEPGAKRAELSYRSRGQGQGWTWLELRPKTGRMHQIRVQAAVRGWPVRGDSLYGSGESFGPNEGSPQERIIALHGRQLTFLHPIRFEPITVIAPLPPVWHPYLGVDPGL